jgi:hypothetical protein
MGRGPAVEKPCLRSLVYRNRQMFSVTAILFIEGKTLYKSPSDPLHNLMKTCYAISDMKHADAQVDLPMVRFFFLC